MELRVWFRCHFSVRNVHGQKGVEKGRRGGKKGVTQGGFCSLGYGVHTVCRRFKIIGEGLFIFYLCIAPVFISIPVPCEKQHYAGFGVQDTIKILITQIPTFAREATCLYRKRRKRQNNFSSRPCARGDMKLATSKGNEYISIPAPARGATHYQPATQGDCADFNSRPCARGDRCRIGCSLLVHIFQFPPLREGRLPHPPRPPSSSLFQFPPLREGRRTAGLLCWMPAINFKSRPCARGD